MKTQTMTLCLSRALAVAKRLVFDRGNTPHQHTEHIQPHPISLPQFPSRVIDKFRTKSLFPILYIYRNKRLLSNLANISSSLTVSKFKNFATLVYTLISADSAPHQHRTTPDLLQGHSTLTPTTKHLDPLTSSSLLGLGRHNLGDHGGLESLLCNLAGNQQLGLGKLLKLLIISNIYC